MFHTTHPRHKIDYVKHPRGGGGGTYISIYKSQVILVNSLLN